MPASSVVASLSEASDALSDLLATSVRVLRLLAIHTGWSFSVRGVSGGEAVRAKFSREPRPKVSRGVANQDIVAYSYAGELDRPLSTGERFVTVRPYVRTTLANTAFGHIGAPLDRRTLDRRARMLVEITRAVTELHSAGIVHGDIRPSNVAYDRSGRALLLDFGDPVPTRFLSVQDSPYRAPEGSRSSSSDVYSLGVLYQNLLFNHINPDDLVPDISVSGRQLGWLIEACTSSIARERPNAAEMWSFVSGDRSRHLARSSAYLHVARRRLTQLVVSLDDDTANTREVESVFERSAEQAIASLEEHPETALAITTNKIADALLALIPIDISSATIHTHQHEDASAVAAEFVTSHPDEIDDDWNRRLHSQALRYQTDESERQELFADAQDFASELREQLLSTANYFDANGLARLMTRDGVEVTAETVGILRQWDYLFAVPDHDRWLYPDFQFDPDSGAPFSEVREVQQIFGEEGTRWGVLSWWLTPHPLFDGNTPAESLSDPRSRQRLTDAAEFSVG